LAYKIALAVRRASPEFDQRYRAARARRDELAPRMRELKEQWARWEALRGSSAEDIDKLLDAHRRTLRHAETQQAGFGMAALPYMAAQTYESRNELAALLAFRKDRGRVPNSFQELLERELGTDHAGLFLHERGLSQALADDLFALAEAMPLLLALDTYELADQHDDWLRMTILANGSSRMLTIMAGRNRHDEAYRRTFMGGLASLVRSYNLSDQTLQGDEMHDLVREFVRADTLSDGRNGFDWPALADGLRRALPCWIGWPRLSQEQRNVAPWPTPIPISTASAPTRDSWRWWAMRVQDSAAGKRRCNAEEMHYGLAALYGNASRSISLANASN
jgi:hypothetical protein